MIINPSPEKNVPYSQYFRCSAALFNDNTLDDVFRFLLAEYLYRFRTKNKSALCFPISTRKIELETAICRQTASKKIQQLVNIGLIDVDDEQICTLDFVHYLKCVYLYSFANKTDKAKIQKAFLENDRKSLEEFGYGELTFNIDSEIADLSKGGQNINKVVKNLTTWLKYQPDGQKFNHVDENLTTWLNFPMLYEFASMLKIQPDGQNINHMVKKLTTSYPNFDEFANQDPDEILQRLISNAENLENPENLQDLIEILVKIGINSVISGWLKILPGGYIFNRGVVKNLTGGVKNLTTVNIIKEKEKKIIEQNQDFEQGVGEVEQISQLDKNILDLGLSGYRLSKQKEHLQKFSEEEIELIISNITQCVDRADKIFINQLWTIAEEYCQVDDVDEDGCLQEGEHITPDKFPVPADRIQRDLLQPALESTLQIIEDGYVEVNGQEIPVTAEPLDPDNVCLIVDWKKTSWTNGQQVYVITKTDFRNIYAPVETEDTSTKRFARSLDSREYDYQYMQKILEMGNTDEGFANLTPIEAIVCNFLIDYFEIDDDNTIIQPKQKELSRDEWRQVCSEISQYGITQNELINIFFKDRPDRFETLNLRNRMFSATAIQHWNAINGHQSLIEMQNEEIINNTPETQE